ncbi:MAG TPA: hypothetical protein VKE74_09475 [Gemmataceae bacterium]|nr:hypothetical protein [Gemmataceae bacterium]
MRKLLLSLCCVLGTAGLVLAGEVTLLKYDAAKKEVTVKEGDKEAIYRITDKTRVVFVNADGSTKAGEVGSLDKILGSEKAAGKAKFEITTDKDNAITEIKFKGRKGK